jgi:hypothetical protein
MRAGTTLRLQPLYTNYSHGVGLSCYIVPVTVHGKGKDGVKVNRTITSVVVGIHDQVWVSVLTYGLTTISRRSDAQTCIKGAKLTALLTECNPEVTAFGVLSQEALDFDSRYSFNHGHSDLLSPSHYHTDWYFTA